MGFAVLILSFFGYFTQSFVYAATNPCPQKYCVAIIDAGSTGSRLHLYAYDVDNSNTPIAITEVWNNKVSPGFSVLEAKQSSVDDYLNKLFSGRNGHHFPVYFYATAGMRLLPYSKQKELYSFANVWFANHTNWELIQAKTITGSEEGLFGWLAVNYQLGTLKEEGKAVGVLDTGGASVQISFPVKDVSQINNQDLQKITVYGHTIQLFVRSFLGLGQTEVSHQFLNSSTCFPNDYALPNGYAAQGDVYACKTAVSSLMTSVHQVDRVVQPVVASNPVSSWFALGGVVEMAKKEPFRFSDHVFNNEQLLKTADSEVCQQAWQSLTEKYPDNEYLYGYCLFPAYFSALFLDGYGLKPEQPIHYLSSRHQSGDWTIGVVLGSNLRKMSGKSG
jgi:hypothetical protein